MKVLLPLTKTNYKDFNLIGKTIVYKHGMVIVDSIFQVEYIIESYDEVYLISGV